MSCDHFYEGRVFIFSQVVNICSYRAWTIIWTSKNGSTGLGFLVNFSRSLNKKFFNSISGSVYFRLLIRSRSIPRALVSTAYNCSVSSKRSRRSFASISLIRSCSSSSRRSFSHFNPCLIRRSAFFSRTVLSFEMNGKK